jgi:hypothetical protein
MERERAVLARFAPTRGLRQGKVELSRAASRPGRSSIGPCRAGHQGGADEIAGAAEELPWREFGPEAGRGRRAIDQEHGSLSRPAKREKWRS